jgi:hypothetical protein
MWHRPAARRVLRFETVIRLHLLCAVLVATGVVGIEARAQVAEPALSVDDGVQVRTIARLVDGRWVDATACLANANQSSRDRLVVSGRLLLSTIRAVGSGSPEWVRLAPTIVDLFGRREREQRLDSDRTSDAPRVVEWIYAAEDGDRRIYYFEASRRVASPGDPDDDTDPPGTVRIAVAGFLQEVKERLVPLGTKSELRWEQDGLPAGPSRPDLMPLGVVRDGDRSVWVMNGRSGTSSWFTLYEVGPSGTRTALTVRPARC